MSGSAESESRHFTGIPGAERVFFYALRTLNLREFCRGMNAVRTADNGCVADAPRRQGIAKGAY